mmetsp:Transcript_156378/g.291852  ORF Transcript_156378/g.291852 Transcript_156378/m.291852 type:complete len:221 (-) Transcript_156378:1352-2014(-)
MQSAAAAEPSRARHRWTAAQPSSCPRTSPRRKGSLSHGPHTAARSHCQPEQLQCEQSRATQHPWWTSAAWRQRRRPVRRASRSLGQLPRAFATIYQTGIARKKKLRWKLRRRHLQTRPVWSCWLPKQTGCQRPTSWDPQIPMLSSASSAATRSMLTNSSRRRCRKGRKVKRSTRKRCSGPLPRRCGEVSRLFGMRPSPSRYLAQVLGSFSCTSGFMTMIL